MFNKYSGFTSQPLWGTLPWSKSLRSSGASYIGSLAFPGPGSGLRLGTGTASGSPCTELETGVKEHPGWVGEETPAPHSQAEQALEVEVFQDKGAG